MVSSVYVDLVGMVYCRQRINSLMFQVLCANLYIWIKTKLQSDGWVYAVVLSKRQQYAEIIITTENATFEPTRTQTTATVYNRVLDDRYHSTKYIIYSKAPPHGPQTTVYLSLLNSE